MFERHTFEAGSAWNTVIPLAIFALFVFLFVIAPSIRRRPERGRTALHNFRVIAIFGRTVLGGGGFSRVAVFDDFFLLVGIGHARIAFKDVREPVFTDDGIAKLRFSLNGVEVCLFGDTQKLRALMRLLG